MKKIVVLMIMVFMLIGLEYPAAEGPTDEKKESRSVDSLYVMKTYFLKHVSPEAVLKSLSIYVGSSRTNEEKKILIAMVRREYLDDFEALLRKLDVPRRSIEFRIFTIIASRESKPGSPIENLDLKVVVDELKKLLNYRYFSLDGSSVLTVKEGARRGSINLSSSHSGLTLELEKISINSGNDREKEVEIPELWLRQYKQTLISTATSIRENGYLVVGVSKIGENGDALVLVINARIH